MSAREVTGWVIECGGCGMWHSQPYANGSPGSVSGQTEAYDDAKRDGWECNAIHATCPLCQTD